jgi:hypothetical protein
MPAGARVEYPTEEIIVSTFDGFPGGGDGVVVGRGWCEGRRGCGLEASKKKKTFKTFTTL